MKVAKVTCPACEQPIELPEAETRGGVKCPACQTSFIPQEMETMEYLAAPPTAKTESAPKCSPLNPVREQASSVSALGKFCFWLCLIIPVFTVVVQLNQDYHFIATPYLVAGGFLILGFWLQVVAQLMFIRAAVEEKN